jgi:hypothetical protein
LRLAAALVLALLCGAARAQERPLCADRPGKATPPCILDVGRLQLELAPLDATFDRHDGRDDVYAVAGFEVRAGLTRRSEVQLGWTPLSVERSRTGGASEHVTGSGDLRLGLRTALTDPDGDGFAAALEPFVGAPLGTHGQGAGGWTGGVLLPMSKPVGDASVGFAPEVDVVRDADGRGAHLAYGAALAVGRGFGPTTLGVELWGQVDDDPGGRTTAASADLTAAYVPASRPDLQLDAGLNLGLNRNKPDVEVYVGVARRF